MHNEVSMVDLVQYRESGRQSCMEFSRKVQADSINPFLSFPNLVLYFPVPDKQINT